MEEKKLELLRKAGPGPQAQAEVHRHVRLWSLRLQLYCRMRENFQKTGQSSWDPIVSSRSGAIQGERETSLQNLFRDLLK